MRLLTIARAADPDDWRNQLRDALERGDRKGLKELAASEHVLNLPASSLKLFGDYLHTASRDAASGYEEGVALLRKAQWQHVANFWINESLAAWLQGTNPSRLDESIRFGQAALALRPKSPHVYCILGQALLRKGLPSQAEEAYRQAIKIRSDFESANLGVAAALAEQGKHEEAKEALAKAMKLMPHPGLNLNNWAWDVVLNFRGLDRRNLLLAVAFAEKAVELTPDADYVWNTLGAVYYRAGRLTEAVTTLEKSMKIRQGGDSFDWFFLAMAHQKLGHEKEARHWYERAVQWMEKNAPHQEHQLRRFRAEAEEVLGINQPDKKAQRK